MTVKKSPSNDSRLPTYTEDDTFRILARPNIHKMVELRNQHEIDWKKRVNTIYPTTQNIVICKYHGWNWIEFLIAKKANGYFS